MYNSTSNSLIIFYNLRNLRTEIFSNNIISIKKNNQTDKTNYIISLRKINRSNKLKKFRQSSTIQDLNNMSDEEFDIFEINQN